LLFSTSEVPPACLTDDGEVATCFHGGGFWNDLGDGLERLGPRADVINADVLDAWFPPAPRVVAGLKEEVVWQAMTSPPTHAQGLEKAIARNKGLSEASVLAGPGSSALLYHALRQWLRPDSAVLLIEPSYGEYAHLCEHAIGCRVERFLLEPSDGFQIDVPSLRHELQLGSYDLVVLVNPNNPCGTVLRRGDILEIASCTSAKILVDEAYGDYTPLESVVGAAAHSSNLFVVRSMSKGFALSGLRVAYFVGPEPAVNDLRRWSPPWWVSLPAQAAAVRALESASYYAERYEETHVLREELSASLKAIGWQPVRGVANWVLARLPDGMPSSEEVVRGAAERGLHLRDAGKSAPSLGSSYVRIAVKDPTVQTRVVDLLHAVLADSRT